MRGGSTLANAGSAWAAVPTLTSCPNVSFTVVVSWSSKGSSLFVIEQIDVVARVFRRDIASGKREFVRDIRAQSPAGSTSFEVFVSRNGQAYAYTNMIRLANVYVIEGLR